MSLEGAFEINDHKAAFRSLLNPPPCCSKRPLCLEELNMSLPARASLPTPEEHHQNSFTGDIWDTWVTSQPQSDGLETPDGGAGRWR